MVGVAHRLAVQLMASQLMAVMLDQHLSKEAMVVLGGGRFLFLAVAVNQGGNLAAVVVVPVPVSLAAEAAAMVVMAKSVLSTE
ncbi:hypothetical protein GCM10008110_18350 [Marinobacter persicus]|nr:hypothetical protein GCM10008110_18350 [Marinobacter persicus]